MKVIIYSTPTCPYCVLAKEFFTNNKIKYEDYDVAADHDKAHEMMHKSGQMGVPVIDIDGTIIVGFDQEKIKSLIKKG